jgi:hypothetical protein
MPDQHDPRAIPDRDVKRYRDLRKMAADDGAAPNEREQARIRAERLLTKHPRIEDAVRLAEMREARQQQGVGDMPRRPGPPTGQDWSDMLRRTTMRVVGIDPVDWMYDKLEEAAELGVQFVTEQINDMTEVPGAHRDGGYMTLADVLDDEVDLEVVEEGEDEDGVEIVVIKLTITEKALAKCAKQRNGAKALGELILARLSSTETADDDGDEDEQDNDDADGDDEPEEEPPRRANKPKPRGKRR